MSELHAQVKDLEGAGVHRAGLRRKAVATLLGIGNCPSKVFVRDLNHYGFEREEVARYGSSSDGAQRLACRRTEREVCAMLCAGAWGWPSDGSRR